MSDQSSTHRAAYLAAVLARHYPETGPYQLASMVESMRNAALFAKAVETAVCNGDVQNEEGRYRIVTYRQAKINFALSAEVTRARGPPATVKLGGDPRGPCGVLLVPGMKGDGWGEGFAIY